MGDRVPEGLACLVLGEKIVTRGEVLRQPWLEGFGCGRDVVYGCVCVCERERERERVC